MCLFQTAFQEGRLSVVQVLLAFADFFNDVLGGRLLPTDSPSDYDRDVEIGKTLACDSRITKYLKVLFIAGRQLTHAETFLLLSSADP